LKNGKVLKRFTMKNYLNQLIEDMHNAAKNMPVKPFLEISEDEECLRGVMEYESTEPKPMQEWFGIDKANFPPAEKLTKEELELMVDEILKLWHAYNFDAVLPENLPADIAYKVLVDNFDKPVIWVSEGIIGIEFCDYEPENCPFPEEYCMCKDFKRNFDMEDIEEDISLDNSYEIAILDKEINDFLNDKSIKFRPVVKMERYVDQLIQDLNNITEKVNRENNIPDNIDIRSAEDIRHHRENPFVTIEKLSGINCTAFPDHIDMDGIQIRKVLKAMLQLLDAYRLKVHYPKELPFEMKYETLREGWDTTYIKHLPDSGDDINFCTGDPQTCPFGEYCDCGDENYDFSADEPPEKNQDDAEEDIELPF